HEDRGRRAARQFSVPAPTTIPHGLRRPPARVSRIPSAVTKSATSPRSELTLRRGGSEAGQAIREGGPNSRTLVWHELFDPHADMVSVRVAHHLIGACQRLGRRASNHVLSVPRARRRAWREGALAAAPL